MRDVFNMGASLVAQMIKNLPAIQETQVRSLGWEDPPEKKIANDEPVQAGAGAAASRNSEDNLPPGGHAASASAAPASSGRATPTSRGARCLRTPSSCRPAARSTRRSIPTPPSISQSFPRNVPRDGRWAGAPGGLTRAGGRDFELPLATGARACFITSLKFRT